MFKLLIFHSTVLGPEAEGKSAYINYLMKRTTLKKHIPTTEIITLEYKFKTQDEKNCNVKIFDTPGAKEYESLLDEPISKSDGFLIIFSKKVDRKIQEEKILNFLKKITRKETEKNPTVFLIASMDDLEDLVLDFDDVEDMGLKFGSKFFEVSSKTGNQIEQSFEALIKNYIKEKKKAQKEYLKD